MVRSSASQRKARDRGARRSVVRTTGSRASASFERALGWVVLAGVVILPLVFLPDLDDGYALPKVVALRLLAMLGGSFFVGYLVTGGSPTRKADVRIDAPLLCFVGLFVAATVVSVDRGQSLFGEPYQYQGLVTGLIYVGAFYAARLSLGTSSGVRSVLLAMTATGTLVAVYAIAQQLGFDPFWSGPPDERSISSVGQANDLAAYLVLVVVAALGSWTESGRVGRRALVATLAVTIAALGLTFSRGGYIALVAVVVIWVVPRLRSVATARRTAVAFLAAIIAVSVLIAIPVTRGTIGRVVDRALATSDVGEGSIHMHLDLWRVGMQIAAKNPVLGTGPETFPIVFRPYLAVLPPDRARNLAQFRAESPHNELIGLAAEMGLPAMAVYCVFLIMCAVLAVRALRGSADRLRSSTALVVLSALATHVITTFFMTPEIATSAVFWVMIGAGLAAIVATDSADTPRRSKATKGPRRA